MPMPTVNNPIAMSQLNSSFFRAASASISLGTAAGSGYGSINSNSPVPLPTATDPDRMSEWYNYDETACPGSYSYCSGPDRYCGDYFWTVTGQYGYGYCAPSEYYCGSCGGPLV